MKEKLKPYILPVSLCIAVLVSLVLIVALLVNPARFGSRMHQDKSATLKSEVSSKNRYDIYSPTEVIRTAKDGKQGLLTSETTSLTGELVKNIETYHVESVKEISKDNQKHFINTLNSNNSLMLNYGSEIPVKLLSKIFDSKVGSNNFNVNRMILPLGDNTHFYLLGDNGYHVYEVTTKKRNLNQLQNILNKKIQSVNVQMRTLNDRPFLFYPNRVKMRNYGYLLAEQSQTAYINRVLGNTTDTSVKHRKKSTTYSSRDQSLNFDDDDNVLYQDYKQNKRERSYANVLNSAYGYANKLGIPLDNARFDSYNPVKNTVTYRTFVEGYPVFNQKRLGTCSFTMGNGGATRYEFPLLSFQIPIPTNAESTTLPSTGTVLNQLSAEGIDMKKVRSITLGYQVVPEKNNKQLITLQPSWFVNYDGSWINYQLIGNGTGKESF
ncbi:YycH family regulatory protein [Fructilactobacillus fructivorans]|uniref:YycH family regulatory protein n=1 Tax=Fructilactobacillus fructivorans TaxID=1614 RepID=UPI0007055547|nr:two-component system activity regulator YycH [Fructilactobacillus fructivorans]KRN43114.1 hypothetical protein IV48_GL000923 [Fructilactobacillus fructivorans]